MKAFKYVVFVLLFSAIFGCGEKRDTVTKPVVTPAPKSADGDYAVKKEIQKEVLKGHAEKATPKSVNFGDLTGRNLGGLYSDMLGVSGVIPKTATVNFTDNLAVMWFKKLDRKRGVSEAVIDNAHSPITNFKADPKKMSLKKFLSDAQKEVDVVKKNINWVGVCKSYGLDDRRCVLLQKIANDIRGVDLVAYGMTELMPSAEGDLNVKVLSLLLQEAGSNYVMAIPAMYDSYLSLGLYQFTSFALRDDGQMLEGASRINRHLPETYRIPGSVIKLRNGENHRAAYLFAIHNVTGLVKNSSSIKPKVKSKKGKKQTAKSSELETLEKVHKIRAGDIVTYIATAHHAPTLAIKCARNWLASGATEEINAHLVGRLKQYGKKTNKNLLALEKSV